MATPTPTTRSTPSGQALKDGYQALITFAADPDIEFWEKVVQPPGMDGGDAIDVSTMHNSTYRTFAPRALVTLTEHTITVAYLPTLYTSILAILNVETVVTVRFSNNAKLAFYGYLRTFEPDAMEEGSQPEASVTIQPTNWDYANDVEEAPSVT